MTTKAAILTRMSIFRVQGGGIGAWLTEQTCDAVFDRLAALESDPLRGVQLNQLLVLAHEAPVSDGFFRYYWLEAPLSHPYSVRRLPNFRAEWIAGTSIISLDHLAWGLYRLYVDALLFFGNVRTAFRALRNFSHAELHDFFFAKRIDSDAIKRRGPPLPLRQIEKARRYLIAERACKSYGDRALEESKLRSALLLAYTNHNQTSAAPITVRDLLETNLPAELQSDRENLTYSASEILDNSVTSEAEVLSQYEMVATRFRNTRDAAVKNTEYYLSMITDLDVYVATSMREPLHFVKMAEFCESVFNDSKLTTMNIRYFDPTLSAANGHEDKGLIECLMVKCAKALVYCAGEKESYGKDAEAAMALSLGHPVIFFCEKGAKFYRDVHPLTRLIQFDTGVAVGAMITDRLDDVAELLARTFENRMEYRLEQSHSGSLRLIETLTGSVIRIQTSDRLISETFWNHYHQDRDKRPPLRVARSTETRTGQAPQLRIVPVSTPNQADLALEVTALPRPIAARHAATASSSAATENRNVGQAAPSKLTSTQEMSSEEVFNAVSKVRSDQPTGNKRYRIFSTWLEQENISQPEALKLLRFVESTLAERRIRNSFVYQAGNLATWYREMSNGDAAGTAP